eukprot:2755289-Rhodomonas_salina.1
MVVYAVMLWVRAVGFTARLWFRVAMLLSRGILNILTVFSPMQCDARREISHSVKLLNGATLHTYARTMQTPSNAMLNHVMGATISRILGVRDERGKSNLNARVQPQAYTSSLNPEKPNEMLMVADSGANKHFIPDKRSGQFMLHPEEVDDAIGGMCDDNQARTTKYCIFAASATDKKGKDMAFTSMCFAVKNCRKPLFSE